MTVLLREFKQDKTRSHRTILNWYIGDDGSVWAEAVADKDARRPSKSLRAHALIACTEATCHEGEFVE
jgi:hypothetical protein